MWNAMRKKPRIIQVPMNEDLLERLDAYSSERGQSRSAFIREACAKYVAKLTEEEADRQYAEAYRKFPEDLGEIKAWTRLAAEVWGTESFEDWEDAPR